MDVSIPSAALRWPSQIPKAGSSYFRHVWANFPSIFGQSVPGILNPNCTNAMPFPFRPPTTNNSTYMEVIPPNSHLWQQYPAEPTCVHTWWAPTNESRAEKWVAHLCPVNLLEELGPVLALLQPHLPLGAKAKLAAAGRTPQRVDRLQVRRRDELHLCVQGRSNVRSGRRPVLRNQLPTFSMGSQGIRRV